MTKQSIVGIGVILYMILFTLALAFLKGNAKEYVIIAGGIALASVATFAKGSK